MRSSLSHGLARSVAAAVAVLALAACAADVPLAPERPAALRVARLSETEQAVIALRQATAKYHSLQAAIDDGFTLLHGCEVRPGEGQVGMVYVHFGRVLDGVIDVGSPDALVYEPSASGAPQLVAVEFAVLNSGQPAPSFLGHTFQPEDEFGVYGLHVWVWRDNPEGLFAEANPNVSCLAE